MVIRHIGCQSENLFGNPTSRSLKCTLYHGYWFRNMTDVKINRNIFINRKNMLGKYQCKL